MSTPPIAALIRARRPRLRRRRPTPAPRSRRDRGMSTAEYALGTVAACAFAAILYVVLTSSEVREILTGMVTDALKVGG